MTTTSPLQGLPLPDSADSADVPYYLGVLAAALEKQLAMTYDSATARDAAITAPAEGMEAWLRDSNTKTVYDGTAWGTVPHSRQAWTPYTPVWTAVTTDPTLAAGTLTGEYLNLGGEIAFRIILVFGAGTIRGSGAYSFSLPTTAAMSGVGAPFTVGTGSLRDSSASDNFHRFAFLSTSTTVSLRSEAGAYVTHAVPYLFDLGDSLVIEGRYKPA